MGTNKIVGLHLTVSYYYDRECFTILTKVFSDNITPNKNTLLFKSYKKGEAL